MRAHLVAAALVLGGFASGCKSKDEGSTTAAPAVEQLSPSEKERGRAACAAYIERLCRCAETRPELREECDLIRNARPDALEKALAAAETVDDPHVAWRTMVTARRIMSRCIEDDNRLDPGLCPRVPLARRGGQAARRLIATPGWRRAATRPAPPV
jgi:hypothetical protein